MRIDTKLLPHVIAVLVAVVLVLGASLAAAEPQADTAIRITANASAPGKPLVHFWSKVVGAGRANEGLRSTWQEELETATRYGGFKYVRFHGLFHDDMFVYREDEQGRPIYNFQYVDDLFDRMLQKGVRPFVELSFSPSEMATAKGTTMWWQANGSPPKDYNKWAELVRASVEHWVARYGVDEVRQWYFEVWNEPNLDGFFKNGTQQQYFELYKITAQTIRKVDAKLRVGGPTTSNFELDEKVVKAAIESGKPYDPLAIPWRPVWITDFLAYCKANNLPVDFISTHPYPQDFRIDDKNLPNGGHFRRSVNSTRDDLRMLREMIDASEFPHAEIQLTEWSSSPSPLDHTHDSLAAGAFIVKTNLDSIGYVDSLSYWVFTDVFEENRLTDSVFHGCFGLINYQEIVKPAFHAYRMMNELGDELVERTDGAIVTRDKASGRVTALAYNYPPEEKIALPETKTLEEADAIDGSGSARAMEVHLRGLVPGAAFSIETLDRKHGSAVAVWEAMGKPEPPNVEQTKALREAAWATKKEVVRADSAGNLDLQRSIDPWSLVLVKQL